MSRREMAVDRIDNVPLTQRARDAILQAIVDGRFDERLPSEESLAEMLNVSRTTIRTALQSLEQDGIISRRRAIGTTINAHVRPSTLALQRMVGFDGLLRENGHETTFEVAWRRATPDADTVAAFGLDPDQDSLIADKMYYADGRPAISILNVMPWSGLRDPDFSGEVDASIFEFSQRACVNPIHHAVAEIVPVVKSGENTRLPVEVGLPFTRLHERHYADGGTLVAVSVVDVDNDYFHFEVFRRS